MLKIFVFSVCFFLIPNALLGQDSTYYKKIISECKVVLNNDPNDSETLTVLGIAYLNISKTQLAEKCFFTALFIDSSILRAYRSLAFIYINRESYDSAMNILNLALKMNLENTEIWCMKGISFYNKGEYFNAIECFNKSLSFDRDYYFSGFYLAISKLRLGSLEEAENELLKLSKKKKNDFFINAYLGFVYVKKKKYGRAKEFLKVAEKIDSENHLLNYFYYCFYCSQKNTKKANIYLNKISTEEFKKINKRENGC